MKLMENILFIGEGALLTLELVLAGMSVGLLLGALLAIVRYKGWMVFVINRFISIMRGTPVILQLSFVYFAIPSALGISMNVLCAGIITLGLNSSAYIAEILRAGIESLPKGQFEASQALRIPSWLMWKDIILPQVIKNIFPALINELISLLKETALISTLGGMDLMRRAQAIASEQYTYFAPICIAGCYYYLLILMVEWIAKMIEKRSSYVKHA